MRTGTIPAVALALAAGAGIASALIPCDGGQAGGYPCLNVDLRAFLPLSTFGAEKANDVWGWTDPANGQEYVLLGLDNGTAFIRITDPDNPEYVGKLPFHYGGRPALWRDLEVYADHVFIVADNAGAHGMQVFDLTQLRGASGPVEFGETAWYGGGGLESAHTIAINTETGFAYIAGGADRNSSAPLHELHPGAGGLHIVDIRNPREPRFVTQFDGDGYTHDAQCVVYRGPDAARAGREVCFACNEDTLTVVDVSNHAQPSIISRTSYPGSGYTHQGWLTEDHRFFLLDDELDESSYGHNTRTRIFDVGNLGAPRLAGSYDGPTPATDHNLYVRGGFVYESNYRAGLRILGLGAVAAGQLTEVAYFDVVPESDARGFAGTWSNYPFFPSGHVAVTSINGGVFIVRPKLAGFDTDLDDSGLVDGWDLIRLALSFGLSSGDPRFDSAADVDRNGVVDGQDLALLAASFGQRL